MLFTVIVVFSLLGNLIGSISIRGGSPEPASTVFTHLVLTENPEKKFSSPWTSFSACLQSGSRCFLRYGFFQMVGD